MRRLVRFARLPLPDQLLALYAGFILLTALVRLRCQGVEQLRAWAARPGTGMISADRLVSAARRAAVAVPGTTCLVRALALQHLLSANEHPSELKIGVTKEGGLFEAHAWLMQGGRVLIGEGIAAQTYTVLSSWPGGKQTLAQGHSRA